MREVFLIGWKISSPSINVASVRYRCLLPVLALRNTGIAARVFSKALPDLLNGLACLVFVKSFKSGDYLLALQASQRAIPVVLDLCDNIFIGGYGRQQPGGPTTSPDRVFLQMADLAAMIVVPTESLAEIVKQRVAPSCLVVVIPDGIETQSALAQMIQLLAQVRHEEHLTGLQRWQAHVNWLRDCLLLLKTVEPRHFIIPIALQLARKGYKNVTVLLQSLKRTIVQRLVPVTTQVEPLRKAYLQSIVWFGHHGASYARFGLLDLLAVRGDLEAVSRQHPIELVVVSNSRKKFDEHIQPFELPTRYVEWSPETLATELLHASVALLPNSLDDFSVVKSPNRAVLALLSGVPVVATATPALRELETCIVLDDFTGGLKGYLRDPERRVADVKAAQSLIQMLYGDDRICDKWMRVVAHVRAQGSSCLRSSSPVLMVVLHNQLDWQWLGPVVREALAQGLSVDAVLDGRLSDEVVILSRLLGELGVGVQVSHPDRFTDFKLPASVRALVCATESNLLPHRLAHQIALHARRHGIYTTVVQHGYEMPGLTYHDNLQSIRKMWFASERIYLWGSAQLVHQMVPAATRAKCLTVGCPSGISAPGEFTARKADTPIVGVFENLHWLRYTEKYRHLFIDGLRNLVEHCPEVSYKIRTHPQGRWLDSNSALSLLKLPNVTVAPELGSAEEALHALFKSAKGVITTPSSVALQAAQAGLPVAVVGGGLDLSRYQPLTQLSKHKDWIEFIKRIEDPAGFDSLRHLSSDFVARVIEPGNAAYRIIADIRAHI